MHITVQPYEAGDPSMLASSFQIGGRTQQGRMFHSQRHSLSQRKPANKGAVALNLEEDMKKFKTWHKFNREFEKRLNKQERANTLHIKNNQGDDFKFPSTVWRPR